MKNTIKLALVAAMAMGATSAFATNGDNLIGLGAESRAMGGTGIANYNGANSTLTNPALLAKTKGTEVTFGGTYFRPDVKQTTTGGYLDDGSGSAGWAVPDGTSSTSDAKHNVIPEVALVSELDDGFAAGMGMWGSAGMGVDHRDDLSTFGTAAAAAWPPAAATGNMGLYGMRSSLQLMKLAPSIAYGQDNWGVGAALIVQYGNLAMSFNDGSNPQIGAGASDDLGLGYQVGAFIEPIDGLTVGANYTSAIDMEYKNQISFIGSRFGYTGATAFSDNLEQPAEYGIGIAYTMGDMTLTTDIKRTEWADAKGYKDFGWQSQNTIAIGGEYRMDDLALRAGFNYAKNPLQTQGDNRLNLLNYVMFPATTERHWTAGMGYTFTKQVSMDIALTYAPTQTTSTTAQGFGIGNITTEHTQYAATAALSLNF